jgi:cytidylate kinase
MKYATQEERAAIAQAAERQMRRWTFQCEMCERLARQERQAHEEDAWAQQVGPYVAISRESGAGGGEIAELVGAQLGWEVLDRTLLDYMADRFKMPRGMLEYLDETTASALHEVFAKWIDRRTVSQEEYVVHLGKIILLAAQHGEVVFVGRGAQLFLPRENGIAVRCVAAHPSRVERTMSRRNLGRDEATRFVDQTDQGRRDFVRRYFHHDVADPHEYDLVVNVDRVGLQGAVALIVEQTRQRFGPDHPIVRAKRARRTPAANPF